jgi:hypothetical protein
VTVRRLAARLAGQPAAAGDLLRPGEAIVLGESSPGFGAMAGRSPVLAGQLDAETAVRLARFPGGRELAVGCTSFLAMPLIPRGAIVGCATVNGSDAASC